MTKDKALDLALEALENNRRTHYYCEDTWYSCPKHEDGCANEAEGDECNCGADKANQEIDKDITAIKQARSAPDMSKQPEALRLAGQIHTGNGQWMQEAAAELRRLHKVNQELLEFVAEYILAWDEGMAGDSGLLRTAVATIEKATGGAV